MKTLSQLLSLLLLLASGASAQLYSRVNFWCEQGNQTIAVLGYQSAVTTPVQASYPSGTVTVFITGTVTKATIYQNQTGTVLGNPFTCEGTNGLGFFYVSNGNYDINISGTGALTPPAPFTVGAVPSVNPLYTSDGVLDCAAGNPAYCWPSLQAAVTAAGSGKLYITQSWTPSATITINAPLTIICQSTGQIIQGGVFPVFTLTSTSTDWLTIEGCTITGVYPTHTADCILISGASNIWLERNTVTLCGGYATHLNGDTTLNQHIKVLRNSFSLNQQDAVFSEGALTDEEIAGNIADGTANAANTHLFAAHAGYGGSNYGSVSKLDWHDNTETCGTNNCNEIGSFTAGYPTASYPFDLHLHNNTCKVSGVDTPPGGPACDSLAMAQYATVDDEILDAQGNISFVAVEFSGCLHCTAHGIVENNCAASQLLGISINSSQDVDLSGFTLCGQLNIGITKDLPSHPDVNVDDIHAHDGKIQLQSGFVAAANASGTKLAAIFGQLNDTSSTMNGLMLDHIATYGVSYVDGITAVMLEDDSCTAANPMQQPSISYMRFIQIEFGLGNATNCPFIQNVNYTNNQIGAMTSVGTVTLTNGSTAVSGVSTVFDQTMAAGGGATLTAVIAGTTTTATIASVADSADLTLSAPWAGSSVSGYPFSITSTQQFYTNAGFGSIYYNNYGFFSNVPFGPLPICIVGAGSGGTPGAACSTVSGVVSSLSTPFSGSVQFITTGTPSATTIVTLLVPPGTFQQAPFCSAFIAYASNAVVVPIIQDMDTSTATSIVLYSYSALTTGVTYRIQYRCQ